MPTYRLIACLAAACWLISAAVAHAAQNALIVVGVTGNPTISADLSATAVAIQTALEKRGFPSDSIEVLGTAPGGKVTSDQILASLKKRQALAATDEFWLVLLGFSGRSAEGAMAFQVSGPRLTIPDLKPALDAIPAQQFVFVGTSDSGGFVTALLQPRRTVLSATKEEGEIDLPRFPGAWAAALKENPKADWKAIAARAAALTDQNYVDNNLAQGEHARLGDPTTGKVLEPPFGVDATAQPAEKPQPDGSMALVNASDIKVEIRQPNAEWEKQPATPETKKLIEAARATPNPDGFNSILLEQRLGYKVGEDRSAEDFVMRRVYIAKEDGVAHWANFMFPQDPPAVTTKLEAARIIQPDGSSTVFNPAKMPPATDPSSGMNDPLTMIFLPDAHAGCLVEIAYRTRHLLDVGLPDFSEELPVQLDIPALHTELQLQVPPNNKVHFKLRNSDAKPVESVVDGLRTVSWKLDDLPAFESLPYDPPERDLVVALDISSLDSWDDFATWTRRLLRGSDAQDPTVKAKAAELAAGATTRIEKIRKAYEFVSALRYVAIEFGVNGIRPRTPAVVLQNRYGDCKDKANLLVALLADMDIEGHLSVLNRGSSTDVDFPSWQFNHAIAYVPKGGDGQTEDLWLDTTDSTAPFPTLSPGDIGRNALVFDKETAKFLPVTAQGKDVTNIEEHWTLQPTIVNANHVRVVGTLQFSWTGLAEYDVRSSVRGHSPRQRDFVLQTELVRQLPIADFTELQLTSADDLSLPMRLEAKVFMSVSQDKAIPLPMPGLDIESMFAPPDRNRPLLINNGQKLHLLQTVETDERGKLPNDFVERVAGVLVSVSWKNDNGKHTSTRTAELTVDGPLVASTDYAQVRDLLRRWAQNLSP